MKNHILLCLKLVLLIIVLWWITRSVDLYKTYNVLSDTNLTYFIIAILVNNISTIFLTFKWYRLSSPLKLSTNVLGLLKLNYISIFYSSFIPGQSSGELIKGLKLSRKEKALQKVWIPIFIDKITNLLMIFLIGFVAIIADENLRNNKILIASTSMFTLLFAVLTSALFSENTEKIISYLKKMILKLFKLLKFENKFISEFSVSYFESYKKHGLLMFETLIWSLFVKLPHIFAFFFLALSLNLNLDIIQSAWLFSIISIVTFLPISFSGLGIREGTMIILLSQMGIQSSSALSLSVLIFTMSLIMALIGGIIELYSWLKPAKNK